MPDDLTSIRTPWTTSVDGSPMLERMLAEQRRHNDQLRLVGSAVQASLEAIAILTPAVEASGPRVAFVNEGFCAMYGRDRDEIIGQTLEVFGIVDRQKALFDALLNNIFERRSFQAEATVARKDGAEIEVEMHLAPVEDGGQLTHWVLFLRDVTTARNEVVSLRHQATHDALTGLPNRAMLLEAVDLAISTAQAKGSLFALLLMDLDRFKEVNDTFGHHFGDALLTQVAFRLRNQLRDIDTIARVGGDEFAMVLVDVSDAGGVARIAKKVLNALQQPFVVEEQVLEVGASIGIALFPNHGDDTRTLLRRADVAMYAAKHAQAGFSFHESRSEARSPDQLSLVVEMRSALERGEFEPFFQPKIHLRSGLMTRAEVLVRWRNPRRGLMAPASFVPVAERTGFIRPLTEWLLDKTMAQVRAWQDAGAPVHVAMNISAKSLLDATLPAKVHGLLEKWRLDPRFLKIEITESSIMADPAHALAILSMLQSIGVRLSLDDFGTGYSSLMHLRELPVDEIKIDKSFVMGMTSNDADVAIVRTMVDLAHNLGKQVCAEGVEDAETMAMLRDLNCDLAQGYYIARPLPADDFMQWLVSTGWGLQLAAPRG